MVTIGLTVIFVPVDPFDHENVEALPDADNTTVAPGHEFMSLPALTTGTSRLIIVPMLPTTGKLLLNSLKANNVPETHLKFPLTELL